MDKAMDKAKDFFWWATSQGVTIHPGVIVEKSRLGGYGIVSQKTLEEDTIVLRIPQKFTLDIDTLLELTQNMKRADKSGTVARVINLVLTSGSNFAETAIVRSYIWALSILKAMHYLSTVEVAGLDLVEKYLDILASTEVLNVNELREDLDYLVQSQVREKQKVAAEYNTLRVNLPELENFLTFSQAYQLHQAVKSRVLEIPHAIPAPERTHDDSDEDEHDNFTTNVTLVPVLDFANHSLTKNAVFDVDRSTNDIILRLNRAVSAREEICISYSPTRNLDVFFRTYGFMPHQAGFYRWKIPHINEAFQEHFPVEDYERIAKWLHIYPYLTVMVDTKGEVMLDLEDFKLPLLTIRGIHYDKDWLSKIDTAELSHMYPGSKEEVITEIERQETENDAVYGGEMIYGVTWNGKNWTMADLIENACEDDAVNDLIASTIPVIQTAIKRSIAADHKHMEHHNNAMLTAYYQHKWQLLQKVAEFSLDDYLRMIEGAYEIEE